MQVYEDHELIVEALRESPELLEVDETGEHVRRKKPLLMSIPEYVKNSAIWRSIYAVSLFYFLYIHFVLYLHSY